MPTWSQQCKATVSAFSPRVEIYSIDECFADLTGVSASSFSAYGQAVRQYTGIGVSVGIASSKTLCKIAVEFVKHDPRYEGVFDLTALSESEVDDLLADIAIEDVWMIGHQYTKPFTSKRHKQRKRPQVRRYQVGQKAAHCCERANGAGTQGAVLYSGRAGAEGKKTVGAMVASSQKW